MALFQRQPTNTDKPALFSVGLNKTLIIVGLGNIGSQYDHTRHNVGFEAVDALVGTREELGNWQDKKNFSSHFSIGQFADTRVVVIKPSTLMNLSGDAVTKVMDFYKIASSQLLVVHDELDIIFGQIRTRTGGTSAGHNGVQSIIDKIGEDFSRLRIGIGPKNPPQIDSADFVLGKFSKSELELLPDMKKEVSAIMVEFIYSGQINQETRSFIV